MGGIFGSSKPAQAQQPTAASGVNIQTSVYGQGIALVVGTTMVAPNAIWSGNFQSYAHSSGGGGSGKGGSGSGGGSTSYTYTDGVAFGLCEGPIQGVGTIWQNNAAYTPQGLGYTVFYGAYPQEGWQALAAINTVVETHIIPTTAPYTITVNYPPTPTSPVQVAAVTSGGLVVMTQVLSGPATGQFVYTSGTGYQFSLADVGKSIVISGVGIMTIPDGLAGPFITGVGLHTVSLLETMTSTPMALVTGTPATGQYSFAAGVYTFAGADVGSQVTFGGGTPQVIPSSRKINPTGQTSFGDKGVKSSTGLAFTMVGSAWTVANANVDDVAGANEYMQSAGVYTFNAANAGEQVTISYTSTTAQPPNQALNYNGLAYIANYTLDLGSSASLPNHQVEVYGFLSQPYGGLLDANPAAWVELLLTNQQWGMGTLFPASLIGDLTSYSAYAQAMGLLISAAYTQQITAAQILSDLAAYTNADVVWTTTLTIIPRGDQAVSANGAVYTPPSLTFNLTDDDWMPTSNASTLSGSQVADPLVGSRADSAELANQVTLEYLDRTIAYAPNTAVAQDSAAIAQFGLNPAQSQQAHIFALGSAARLSAQLILQRTRQPNTWTGTVGEHQICIEIGDWGTISSVVSGVPAVTVRVTEVTEQSDGSLTLNFEEILTGAGSSIVQGLSQVQTTGRNYTIPPPNTDAPLMFEAPLVLAGEVGALEVWLYANGGANWGGAQVWVSSDNITYQYQGNIISGARIGSLTAVLPAGLDPDTTDILALQLVESGQLLSGSQSDADGGVTALYVDGEIISYATATLTGTNAYNLSYLRRGQFDTTVSAHPIGARVVRMDSSVFKLAYTPNQIGQTLSVKLLSYNQYGGAVQGLSDVEPYTYTLLGQEAPPDITGLSTVYVAGLLGLGWNTAPDPRAIDYEVRLGSTWASGQLVGNPTVPSSDLIGDGSYWVCARYRLPNGTPIYSVHPAEITVSGSSLIVNEVAISDQAALNWPGTFVDTYVSNGYLTLQGADLLSQSNILALSDVIMPGNQVVSSGTYQASVGVTISGPTACNVIIKLGSVIAFDVNALDLTQATDVTQLTDVLSFASGGQAKVLPQINLSQDGVTFSGWQNWQPGSYVFKSILFRLLLITTDVSISVKVSGFAFTVNVPNRTDAYTVSTAAGTATQVFTMPFNGGPAPGSLPHIQYSVANQQAGDVITFTTTLSQVVFTASNGGSPVVRTINILAQGY